uniref:Uncharacterized protein n=1 Tax=Ascaris lumbricoides TaxID=6252 RepID=A0A0M3IU36_ASCLU
MELGVALFSYRLRCGALPSTGSISRESCLATAICCS